MAARQMSLEAALEEERLEVENLIAAQQTARQRPASLGHRSPSPLVSPRSPVRSMLDLDMSTSGPRSPQFHAAPVRSMLDISSPPAPPAPVRSMLDIDSPPSVPPSAQASPTLAHKSPPGDNLTKHRSMSDTASKPPLDALTRSPPPMSPTMPTSPRINDLTSAYRFHDILPTNVGQALPGRRSPAVQQPRSNSIGEALRGSDLSNLVIPGEQGRSSGRSYQFRSNKAKSKSPSNRFSLRSSSPFASSSKRGQQSSNTLMLQDGQVVNMDNAYRKLSDVNLRNSNLASLARKKVSDGDGLGRIEKDNLSPYGELLSDESEDDVVNTSDEENERGRKLTTRAEMHNKESSTDSRGTAKSLLAAVEDERKLVSGQPQYRSLFDDPEITITGPSGEKSKSVKGGKQMIQPTTSFDVGPGSGTETPLDAELDADVSAIRDAQRLQLSSTAIISTPEVHRSIRILYRGEYTKIQLDAGEDNRRLRKYLVATDLSDESTHALEWTIGTVLRDGDTLVAMYCMDEETSGSQDAGNLVPDDPKAMKEQAAVVNAMAKGITAKPPGSGNSSPFAFNRVSASPRLRAADSSSAASSPAPGSRGKDRLEEERDKAVQDITDRVSKLLRKTQLQVRVIVEVIHCKNPKHMITEVIDLLSPTLVILGSRGRSALKGTLLGSFSNYLVTKSSAPVMVARKRLRKKTKYQAPPIRQVNNLSNPNARSLETARID